MPDIPRQTRLLVYARADQRCEICGVYAYGGSVHHRHRRGMGGTKRAEINGAANLLLLCGSGITGCHGVIESNRDLAYEQGRLLRHIQIATEVPVLTRHGLVLLDNLGNYIPLEGAA